MLGLPFSKLFGSLQSYSHCHTQELRNSTIRGVNPFRLRSSCEWRKTFGSFNGTIRGEAGNKIDTGSRKEGRFIPDAVMVLGGGQMPDGGVPDWVKRRLDKSAEIHNAHNGIVPIVCLGGGSPHKKPLLSVHGHVIHEGTSLAAYLVQKGIRPDLIYKEWGSYDTVANAYFALVWHTIPRQWRYLSIITSTFHMERTQLAFRWLFSLQHGPRVDGVDKGNMDPNHMEASDEVIQQGESSVVVTPQDYHLQFIPVSDHGIDEMQLQARREKEFQSVKTLKGHISRIHSLKDFHTFFHTEHKAYNVESQDEFGRGSAAVGERDSLY